jgi:hypothetical protein
METMGGDVGGYRQINKSLNICAFDDYLQSQQDNLPEMPDVEQITPAVLRVLGQNPGKARLPYRTVSTTIDEGHSSPSAVQMSSSLALAKSAS